MSHARLLSIEVENFKSYQNATRLDLKPLTVLVGRNNSGKSTLVQALSLLKQTLDHPRADVPLNLVGVVEALNLRELTHGWPEKIDKKQAPAFTLTFESVIDAGHESIAPLWRPATALSAHGVLSWESVANLRELRIRTTIWIRFREDGRRVVLDGLALSSRFQEPRSREIYAHIQSSSPPSVSVFNRTSNKIAVTWDHFIPHLALDTRGLDPLDEDHHCYELWQLCFEQPLADLRELLRGFGFLGSTRAMPPTLYRVSAAEPPESIGASGEYAAELLHARRNDLVHYLPPLSLTDNLPSVPDTVRAKPLVEAVNDVLRSMGIADEVAIDDVRDIGFRLMLGKASLQHVGRGFTYLLPLITYGLLLDPMRFQGEVGTQRLDDFLQGLTRYSLAALEEPEAHIHPKLQSQLAHWFVALAMSGRNLIVETHSDHFVRRLRGLVARAPAGSALETWLRENVSIVEVSKSPEGVSTLHATTLDDRGGFERWPADFMDAATDEEREIYDAALDKPVPTPTMPERVRSKIQHDVGEEPEEG
jgi:energy-coupling factor transporter ATP-binding protein EcfA2